MYAYDDMGGTLSIVDGKAYTDDTEIVAALAEERSWASLISIPVD